MSKFYTCPNCGSNLDHGEICDCEADKRPEQQQPDPALSAGSLATGNPREPVLALGA